MNPKVHVSLDVSDLAESVHFYSALFGSTPTKLKPGYAKFDLDRPAINLTMQQAEHCCLQGLNHMGIRVESNAEIESCKSRLLSAGIRVEDEVNATCCHALQDKIWAKDPSGYRWEVYVFKADVEDSKAENVTAHACCPS
jgi:catechol 2,3-dioxygenase-like lactoylglutathione lyase family enzyme